MTYEKLQHVSIWTFFHLLLTTTAVGCWFIYKELHKVMMRIECLSLSYQSMLCGVNALLKTQRVLFFLSRRGVLLIRSVLFLSINPSELEKSCSPHFPWPRASVLCLSTGWCSLAGVAQHAAHQQFIIILHCIQCFSDVIGISLSVCLFFLMVFHPPPLFSLGFMRKVQQ